MRTCAPTPSARALPPASFTAVRYIKEWLRALKSAHTYNPAQPMRRWFCPIVITVTMLCFAWSRAGKPKKSSQTQRLANTAKNAGGITGNEGNGMDLRFDFGDAQDDAQTDVENAVENRKGAASASSRASVAERVVLPDGIIETLSTVDREMASVLLELYVLQKARTQASEGRGWSRRQLNEQLKAAQEKLRAARGCGECEG